MTASFPKKSNLQSVTVSNSGTTFPYDVSFLVLLMKHTPIHTHKHCCQRDISHGGDTQNTGLERGPEKTDHLKLFHSS